MCNQPSITAVSYTHLDVYKRQGLDAAMEWQSEEFQKRSDITCVFNSNISDITAVSYTHLDVYKRQVLLLA